MSDVNTVNDPGTPAEANETPTTEAVETKETPEAADLPGGEETKPEGGDLPGGEEEAPEAAKAEAPEKYEAFNLQEGYVMSDTELESYSATAKELELSQDQAQKLINFDSKRVLEQQKADADEIKGWQEANKKEFGDKYKAEYLKGDTAFKAYFSEPLRIILNSSGITSHPDFFKALAKIGGTISEDSLVQGDGRAVKGKTLQDQYKYVDEQYGK